MLSLLTKSKNMVGPILLYPGLSVVVNIAQVLGV